MLRSRARYRISIQLPEVLPVPDFQKVLERERARADRAAAELSLLLLDVGGAEWGGVSLHEPLLAFTRRLRLSDEVGWFDRRTVGVLLPDTGAPGAHKLADELEALLAAWHVRGKWKVFTYPAEWTQGEGHGPSAGEGVGEKVAAGGNGAARRRAASTASNASPASPASTGSNGTAAPTGAPAPNGVPASANGRKPAPEARPERAPDGAVPAESSRAKSVSVEPLRRLFLRRSSLAKRTLDVLGASIALVLLSPVMLIAAVAVKLSSPGPVIFRQTRVGLGGRHFDFYKFRTMYVDAEERKKDLLHRNEVSGPVFKIKNDPRMTGVGKLLRKSSIDELPQLWNVLRGDMSLVGPRPPVPAEVRVYDPWQHRRLEVPGGLTCIWQVSGRSEIPFEDWVRMDIRYGKRRSLWYDLGLLARTIPAVLTGRGAR